jgi:hypothetical protein
VFGKLLAEVDEIRGGGDDVAAAAVGSLRLLLSSGGGAAGSPGGARRDGGDVSGMARPSGGDAGDSLLGGVLSRGDMEMAEEVICPKPFRPPPPINSRTSFMFLAPIYTFHKKNFAPSPKVQPPKTQTRDPKP